MTNVEKKRLEFDKMQMLLHACTVECKNLNGQQQLVLMSLVNKLAKELEIIKE